MSSGESSAHSALSWFGVFASSGLALAHDFNFGLLVTGLSTASIGIVSTYCVIRERISRSETIRWAVKMKAERDNAEEAARLERENLREKADLERQIEAEKAKAALQFEADKVRNELAIRAERERQDRASLAAQIANLRDEQAAANATLKETNDLIHSARAENGVILSKIGATQEQVDSNTRDIGVLAGNSTEFQAVKPVAPTSPTT